MTFGLPAPPDSGARVRDYNLIKRVSDRHEVSVLSLLEFQDEMKNAGQLERFCKHVDGQFASRSWPGTFMVAMSGLFGGRPLATAPFYYAGLARRLRALTQSQRFDLVQFEHSFLAPYRFALAPQFSGSTVLSLHNIGLHQYRSMFDMSSGAARIPAALKWWLMRKWETQAIQEFDHTIVVTDEDRNRLREIGIRFGVSVIENGVDCDVLQPLPKPDSDDEEMLFCGTMGYLPNRDGISHFCREILPIIRARRPRCKLRIVGSGGLEHLADLVQPGVVEVTGRVASTEPFYARSHLVIVPLRSGGGSRLKILEAMALGRPVVSTSLGCEGLELRNGRELLIADEPTTFADNVIKLFENNDLWRELVTEARSRVESRYDWGLAANRLLSLYQRLAGQRASATDDVTARGGASETLEPRLSVIIPVYNMRRDLRNCLDALEQSTMRDFQLIIVDDYSSDGSDRVAQGRCDVFVRLEKNSGQSAARNLGASHARASLLFFLDADVMVEPDTLERIVEVFQKEPEATAAFCSYQPDTPAGNFVSQFKNLLHHYTHQISNREAATFCGGFGAIKRSCFIAAGGFKEEHRALEDVDLGYRLFRAGHRILLCRGIQLTHTKRYTLSRLVRSDLLHRAIPWTRIMLEKRLFRRDLNTRGNNIASVITVFLMILALFFSHPWAWLPVLAETGLLALLIMLNIDFLQFLKRQRGVMFCVRAVPMLWFQYFYSGLGLVVGVLAFAWDRLVSRWKPVEERSK